MQIPEAIQLHELNAQIKSVLREGFILPVWIIAEINQINIHRSGHCYMELVEKDVLQDTIIASIRGTIWASSYQRIAAIFRNTTGQELQSGMKVLLKAQVDFHEVYGISLNIRDVDPNFTLGDQARKRAEILEQLREAGVLTMNQELELPRVVQRIAIISSSTAAGFEDFIQQLTRNSNNFKFYWKLFPAFMQGDQAVQSILGALDRIAEYQDFFEAVVIIRGGGSKTDLSYFDDFNLAYYITQFPIPIITGIGHERDESIIDEVSHTRCKTPTAVASFILEQAEQFEAELDWLKDQISHESRNQLLNHRHQMMQLSNGVRNAAQSFNLKMKDSLRENALKANHLSKRFMKLWQDPLNRIQGRLPAASSLFLNRQKTQQQHFVSQISNKLKRSLENEKHRVVLVSRITEHLNPENILKRGYSISYFQGSALKDPAVLKPGDEIFTRLAKGSFKSKKE